MIQTFAVRRAICAWYFNNKNVTKIIVNLQSMERITVVVCDHQARDLLSCVDRAMLSNGKIIASGVLVNYKRYRC